MEQVDGKLFFDKLQISLLGRSSIAMSALADTIQDVNEQSADAFDHASRITPPAAGMRIFNYALDLLEIGRQLSEYLPEDVVAADAGHYVHALSRD